MQFLGSIRSVDDWPLAAMDIVRHEEAALAARSGLSDAERVRQLRRLSYLCHLAQWGCLAMTEEKISAYRRSRDYYIEAETLAHGDRYRRVAIPWKQQGLWGNLHLPEGTGPHPLVVILHGMDDSKEEHLTTAVGLQERGFAVLCYDGPGQAESLFLDKILWPADFHESSRAAVDVAVEQHGCDRARVALIGMSWGGLWALKAATVDPRVRAVYDLGGPVDANGFERLPYFLKTKFCQIMGVDRPPDVPEAHTMFSLKHPPDLLDKVTSAVRVVHGGRDPLVSMADKEWLVEQLRTKHPGQDVTLLEYADGDHCCTAYAEEIRGDAASFFRRVFAS